MQLRTLHGLELSQKTVLLRLDLNVPVSDGVVQDDTRIQSSLPTLKLLLAAGAKVIVLSHFGRPKGQVVEKLKLDLVAKALSTALDMDVRKFDSCMASDVSTDIEAMNFGTVCMLENTRFYPGEKSNDSEFTKQLSSLADIFVNDAFGAIHRAHASTCGLADHLPAYAGLLVEREVSVLSKLMSDVEKPLCLIVGGAKIDTKIGLLKSFLGLADSFLIGGALANTFLFAEGFDVAESLYQEDKVDVVQDFLLSSENKEEYVYIPSDVVVADEISKEAPALNIHPESVEGDMKILDIGAETTDRFIRVIQESKTIIWNGPMGLYEFPQFESGTRRIAEAVAASKAVSVVGGGDSIDAINNFRLSKDDFTHISTGGGAMLEFLEGKELPGLEKLKV